MADALLKGCKYHYSKAVTRLAKNSSVVTPGEKSDFCKKCTSLVYSELSEFTQTVTDIRSRWPRSETWLNWWLIPENAQMIFQCMQKMTPHLAAQLPQTSNPEEAMHATIYRGVGKGNNLFDGLNGLLGIEKYYRQQYEAKRCMFSMSFYIRVKLIKL